MTERADRLELCGLEVVCVIGDLPEERVREQRLTVDVALSLDLNVSALSDRLADTVDYAALAESIRTSLKLARHRMIEAAARDVAMVCLADRRVASARVRIEKPGVIPGLRAAAVTMVRERSEVAL